MMRILIACAAPQWVATISQLAKSIDRQGENQVLVVHPPGLDPSLGALLGDLGMESRAVGDPLPPDHPPRGKGWKSVPGRLGGKLYGASVQLTAVQLLLERRLLARLERDYPVAAALLSTWKPDVVMSFGDRHGGLEACILKAAREAGISVVIPYMAYSDPEGAIDVRKSRLYRIYPFSSAYYRWAFRRYRSQVYQDMLFYQPFQARALERFGALPTNGWTFGCGISDYVCVDSRHTLERYAGYGVPKAKLRIVGDVSSDRLFRAFARKESLVPEIRAKYRLDPGKPNIIVSLPHLAEHGLLPWDRHFEEIEFLMAALAGTGKNVLVSLHPKMDRKRYAYLEEKHGCRILEERLADSLPAADVFVATLSSTVMWAILCGVKPVVLDYLGLKSLFGFLTSIALVRRREDLAEALRVSLEETDRDFSHDWESLSREEVFDGRTIERYREVLAECLAAKGR